MSSSSSLSSSSSTSTSAPVRRRRPLPAFVEQHMPHVNERGPKAIEQLKDALSLDSDLQPKSLPPPSQSQQPQHSEESEDQTEALPSRSSSSSSSSSAKPATKKKRHLKKTEDKEPATDEKAREVVTVDDDDDEPAKKKGKTEEKKEVLPDGRLLTVLCTSQCPKNIVFLTACVGDHLKEENPEGTVPDMYFDTHDFPRSVSAATRKKIKADVGFAYAHTDLEAELPKSALIKRILTAAGMTDALRSQLNLPPAPRISCLLASTLSVAEVILTGTFEWDDDQKTFTKWTYNPEGRGFFKKHLTDALLAIEQDAEGEACQIFTKFANAVIEAERRSCRARISDATITESKGLRLGTGLCIAAVARTCFATSQANADAAIQAFTLKTRVRDVDLVLKQGDKKVVSGTAVDGLGEVSEKEKATDSPRDEFAMLGGALSLLVAFCCWATLNHVALIPSSEYASEPASSSSSSSSSLLSSLSLPPSLPSPSLILAPTSASTSSSSSLATPSLPPSLMGLTQTQESSPINACAGAGDSQESLSPEKAEEKDEMDGKHESPSSSSSSSSSTSTSTGTDPRPTLSIEPQDAGASSSSSSSSSSALLAAGSSSSSSSAAAKHVQTPETLAKQLEAAELPFKQMGQKRPEFTMLKGLIAHTGECLAKEPSLSTNPIYTSVLKGLEKAIRQARRMREEQKRVADERTRQLEQQSRAAEEAFKKARAEADAARALLEAQIALNMEVDREAPIDSQSQSPSHE